MRAVAGIVLLLFLATPAYGQDTGTYFPAARTKKPARC